MNRDRGPQPGRTLDVRREVDLEGIGTEFDFGVREIVVTRDDFSLKQAKEVLVNETIATLGYGRQGRAQALNLRDNGITVVIGVRQGNSYEAAKKDGWIPGVNLFSLEDAAKRGTIVQMLLPDSEQVKEWPKIKPLLQKGSALYFSHGFGITYGTQTGIMPPEDVDVIMVAPKGAGWTVRDHFEHNRGINSSFAVAWDATGRALKRALAMGMAIGSGFLFSTTFENEVFSDLTGERGDLIGATDGLSKAGYKNLRELGFSPEQAAKLSIVKLTHVISEILGKKGADGLIEDLPKESLPAFTSGFKAAYEAAVPVYKDLYERVASGIETRRVIEVSNKPDYFDMPGFKGTLSAELDAVENSELEKAATVIRGGIKEGSIFISPTIDNQNEALMAGAFVGLMYAQYDLFRSKGHKPSEADNETKEEATQSLFPQIDTKGMATMYRMCSTTAQRGALDWNPIFERAFYDALKEVYKGKIEFYPGVIDSIQRSEMLRADRQVMELRPENQRLA